MTRLLVMMAHPDDAEVLVGGTLLVVRSVGWSVRIASMTAGDCGSATHTKEEIVRTRLAEAEAAAKSIEADYRCAGMKDVEVFFNPENLRIVVELLRASTPDVVITHSPVDYMTDHEEASRLVRSAVFAAAMTLYETQSPVPAKPLNATPALYYADPVEGTDPLGNRTVPQFYVDISSRIEDKRRLLSLHASQREWLRAHHGMDEYLEKMTLWAKHRGEDCGVQYAEGLRQHLGHGYPHEPLIQSAIASFIRTRS